MYRDNKPRKRQENASRKTRCTPSAMSRSAAMASAIDLSHSLHGVGVEDWEKFFQEVLQMLHVGEGDLLSDVMTNVKIRWLSGHASYDGPSAIIEDVCFMSAVCTVCFRDLQFS